MESASDSDEGSGAGTRRRTPSRPLSLGTIAKIEKVALKGTGLQASKDARTALQVAATGT